ncbi:Oidioi.mRNA.OKI2018_I69.YSR.g17098.t1.cds [Oikopleura dioica]|uniref:Oidioi.mRNA.OKI2018_I69.YSR.g17096.t1.cds n=1 Tax=Oikopleura dioica TaxID=34765 RepID=A0ABN7SMT8_OIKDI|nr:Oidioi.mRNA.OKI2018_I69.YSR.g17096.t1.cds [Oikopleura dioica]CAG5101448.1 Oidioi.mRNA.OKI2018_I69.YSR.g17098.t1.cds [Oikopleura dioica]
MGSRIGSSKTNAEALLLYRDVTLAVLRNFPESKRGSELLHLLEDKQLAILVTSMTPWIWASFSGPVLRASERIESTIEDVCTQMKSCLDTLDKPVESDEPYDKLVDLVVEEYKDSKYFK